MKKVLVSASKSIVESSKKAISAPEKLSISKIHKYKNGFSWVKPKNEETLKYYDKIFKCDASYFARAKGNVTPVLLGSENKPLAILALTADGKIEGAYYASGVIKSNKIRSDVLGCILDFINNKYLPVNGVTNKESIVKAFYLAI